MGILDDVVTIDTGKTKRGGTWEPVVHNGGVSTSPSYHSRGTDEPVLLYDPDCGFCAAAADMLARLGPQVRIMAGTPAALEYYGVCADRFAHAIPLVNTRHHAIFGSDAIALTLRTPAAADWLDAFAGVGSAAGTPRLQVYCGEPPAHFSGSCEGRCSLG